jgi:hypothetical protein
VLVNPHAFGEPASANPTLHLRRLDGGGVADHYLASFDRVWDTALRRKERHNPLNPDSP